MNSRERIRSIINLETTDRCGFWLGNPHPDSWPRLFSYFQNSSEETIRERLQDDFRWIEPSTAYKHPSGKAIFDNQRKGQELSAGGAFSEYQDVEEIEKFKWPDPDFLDFSEILSKLKAAENFYCASGFWCPFFHDVADFLGMENYFLKMYTHPELVHAITEKIIQFYLEANRRLFEEAGDLIDGFFFGNDFGTQQELLLKPELLETFIFPHIQKLIQLAQSYRKQIIIHSCGSIFKIIPRLISLGVQALHPLQARAKKMDAENLAKHFKGQIAFIGGIDTQQLLVHGSPHDVQMEVKRIKQFLGPHLIISPSHEAILPDIPPQNIEAMAMAV
jgi:uroporphyrinogen decarboxylase